MKKLPYIKGLTLLLLSTSTLRVEYTTPIEHPEPESGDGQASCTRALVVQHEPRVSKRFSQALRITPAFCFATSLQGYPAHQRARPQATRSTYYLT